MMNKYSDIEIQTAQNLLKEGYKWLYRSSFGTLYAYETKPLMNEANFDGYGLLCKSYVPIFQSVKSCDEPVSLESVVHPQILDDVEKKYLSAVIKPFRKIVKYISKEEDFDCPYEFIHIELYDGDIADFPDFKANTMYKGMKLGYEYSLEELGL